MGVGLPPGNELRVRYQRNVLGLHFHEMLWLGRQCCELICF